MANNIYMIIAIFGGICFTNSAVFGYKTQKIADVGIKLMGQDLFSFSNWTCQFCEFSVKTAHNLFESHVSEDLIAKELSVLCNKFKLATTEVCNAITTTFKREVLYIIGEGIIQPRQICGFVIKGCAGSPYDPINSTWSIILPGNKPKPVEPPLPQAGSPTLRVLHLSDIHFDPGYLPGQEVNCTAPLCCRDNGPQSGSGGNVTVPAGHWGNYGWCDIPLHTVENLFQQIRNNYEFDIIYWTGDLPPHNIWNQSRDGNLDIYQNLTTLFMQYFPHKRIFSALGNHESVPVDSFPASNLNIPDDMKNTWLYDKLAKHWTHWLPNSTIASIKKSGSYVTKPYPGLKLISINTQYCDQLNFWLYLNTTDPDNSLKWLADELYDSEKNDEKVHIIGHIAPGLSQCLPTWSKNYYEIVNRFENTIRGQFFGHSHHDSFAVFYDNADRQARPTSYYSVGPSITTYKDIHPAFKMYTLDGNYAQSSWTVLDEETHWMNITDANLKGQPEWKLLYKTKDFYGMPSLRPKDWSNLIEKLKTNQTLLNSYISHYYRRPDRTCTSGSQCQHDQLCGMRTAMTGDKSRLCDDLQKPTRSPPPVSSGAASNHSRFPLYRLINSALSNIFMGKIKKKITDLL